MVLGGGRGGVAQEQAQSEQGLPGLGTWRNILEG